ncbi:MAG: hypothetical protein NW216_03420 [Hyphomicrobium sp.]|nr:hypothetical protein [Hyphomicrobium sp.]
MTVVRILLAALALVAAVHPSATRAAETADFISGTYVIEGRCPALAALQAGGDRNVSTVPETLTRDGFQSWEGGCTFDDVNEISPGRLWRARMDCHEGPEEWEETDTFSFDPEQGTITVVVDDRAVEGERTTYVRCDSGKEPKN